MVLKAIKFKPSGEKGSLGEGETEILYVYNLSITVPPRLATNEITNGETELIKYLIHLLLLSAFFLPLY